MKTTAYTLIIFPLLLISVRILMSEPAERGLTPIQQFDVLYDFDIEAENTPFAVSTFAPSNNIRQTIIPEPFSGRTWFEDENQKITWEGILDGKKKLSYRFQFTGKHLIVNIDPTIKLESQRKLSNEKNWTFPTHLIQSNDDKILELSLQLAPDSVETLREISSSFFKFVYQMPSNSTDELTDALTALDRFEASCNGKSRLLVALFRSKGIPARMVGGIILDNSRKKTSHGWVEAKIGDTWVPFDPLNGHFAEVPANYLELHKGDNFLIRRSKDISFDYFYEISSDRANHYPGYALVNLWEVIDHTDLPQKPLTLLLLLPLGAFLVSVFKNVVGLKTFGVFLPVLIAFAFMEMGTIIGLGYFSIIILLIGLLNYPLEKWGILHTPKISVMLTAVAFYSIITLYIFFKTGWLDPTKALVFPIIILTMMSERFARKVEEDSPKEALNVYIQTLIVTLVCVWVLSSTLIQNFLITFPEFLFVFAGLNLFLGKWIGLRFTEYARFGKLSGVQS